MVQGLDVPVAAGSRGDDLGRAAALEGAAGDAGGGGGRAEPAVVRVADCRLDPERLGGWGTGRPAPEEPRRGAGLVPAVPAVTRGTGDRDVCPVQRIGGGEQGWADCP